MPAWRTTAWRRATPEGVVPVLSSRLLVMTEGGCVLSTDTALWQTCAPTDVPDTWHELTSPAIPKTGIAMAKRRCARLPGCLVLSWRIAEHLLTILRPWLVRRRSCANTIVLIGRTDTRLRKIC